MKIWALILKTLEAQESCALVSVIATQGSAPRDAGARMIVTSQGYHGTIGGGTLEWRAIAQAQAMLGRGEAVRTTSHALGPELGQCCGGRVELKTEVFARDSLARLRDLAAQESEDHRRVYLFGAGHVGRALVLALAQLPFEVHWVDPRPGAFPRAVPGNVATFTKEEPIHVLADAPEGSLVFVMSHSHALDLAIVDAALRHANVAHVGLIGSLTKRARFVKRLGEAGIGAARIDGLICPIGIPGIKSKEPAMIATATAAQILVLDEALRLAVPGDTPQHARRATGGGR